MTQGARWVRLGTMDPGELVASVTGLALAQAPGARPLLLWARTAREVDDPLLRAEADRLAFALVAPAKFAPGRASRWTAWALAPVIAAYRKLGVRAYSDGADLWHNGARIARGASAALGACVVATGSFLPALPGAGFEAGVIEAVFRERLEAQHGWQFDHSWPDARERAAIAEAAVSEPALPR